MQPRIAGFMVLLLASTAAAGTQDKLEPDDLAGPPPEVAAASASKPEVPPLPAFELPIGEPGVRWPRELRVRGKRMLGTELKVKGYITWIYDCVTAQRQAMPKAKRAKVQRLIDEDPTLCERPKFYLGGTRTSAPESSLWVVDVPRPPNKLERSRLPKAELKSWPAVPKLAIGDLVAVTGTWALRSPHAEANSEGLLVFKSLEHVIADATTGPSITLTEPDPGVPVPDLTVVTRAPLRKAVAAATRATSIAQLGACNRDFVARQYDAAIQGCQAATASWAGNHLAWYVLSSVYMAKGEWEPARAAVEQAVTLRPDLGMYQLYAGVAHYEAAVAAARLQQAHAEGRRPEELREVVLEPSNTELATARDALLRATKLAPELWRAHFYLGRVFRELGDDKRAAEQFAATIKTHPTYRFGYIALIELYRRWDYVDQALALALLGTRQVPGADAADLWFSAGILYDTKQDAGQAIAAFTKVLELQPGHARASFQRGLAQLHRGDRVKARQDLEQAAASGDPSLASALPMIRQLLLDLASKK